MHRLFRLLDADNDGYLSHHEFQTGLVAMGLQVAQDNIAVARLINAVDKENTGVITEDSFIKYFWRLKKEDVERTLKQWKEVSDTEIEVVSFDISVRNEKGQQQFCFLASTGLLASMVFWRPFVFITKCHRPPTTRARLWPQQIWHNIWRTRFQASKAARRA